MRLNVFIAKSGYCSRRKADCLIKKSKVKVNSHTVSEAFFKVNEKDEIKINGRLLRIKEHVYILFNKPKGVTTTLYDRFAKRKVLDFIPKKLCSPTGPRLYPVGRLDKDSCGLLILTNDGELCYRVTHPKFSIQKEYLVQVKGSLSLGDCKKAKKGIKSESEHLKIDDIKILSSSSNETVCTAIVHEGKKRHIRRLFKALGFEVKGLKRIRIGSLVLGNLKPGEYKIMDKNIWKKF